MLSRSIQPSAHDPRERRFNGAQAALTAWMLIGLVSAVLLLVRTKLVPASKALLVGFDYSHNLAQGLLAYGAVKAWARWGPRGFRSAALALTLLGQIIGWFTLPDDLSNFAQRKAESLPPVGCCCSDRHAAPSPW